MVASETRGGRVVVVLGGLLAGLIMTGCAGTADDSGSSPTEESASPSASPAIETTATPTPEPVELPRGGRTIFPRYRLFGYSGGPSSPAFGRLGVGDLDARAREISRKARRYATDREAMPVLELIATIVHSVPGKDGMYRTWVDDSVVRDYLRAARKQDALLLLNIQPGRADFVDELRHWSRWLREPDVGVALDPEWAVDPGEVPGQVYGSTSGQELNASARFLSEIVEENDLPQKVMVYHQLTESVVARERRLRRHPGVAMVKSVDGIGARADKTALYRRLTRQMPKPVSPGFKLFLSEDAESGPVMTPRQVLQLKPRPAYVLVE